MMSGSGILTNGKGTRREYGEFNLDELRVCILPLTNDIDLFRWILTQQLSVSLPLIWKLQGRLHTASP